MTKAERIATLETEIAALVADRAFYDRVAREGTAAIYRDNAREQAARLTGAIASRRTARLALIGF
jgi:hypothetical protein